MDRTKPLEQCIREVSESYASRFADWGPNCCQRAASYIEWRRGWWQEISRWDDAYKRGEFYGLRSIDGKTPTETSSRGLQTSTPQGAAELPEPHGGSVGQAGREGAGEASNPTRSQQEKT